MVKYHRFKMCLFALRTKYYNIMRILLSAIVLGGGFLQHNANYVVSSKGTAFLTDQTYSINRIFSILRRCSVPVVMM